MICSSKINFLSLAWLGPVHLTVAEVSTVPHELPGVYLLQHFSARSGTHVVFYVGQSLDLRRRLGEQMSPAASRGVRVFSALRPTFFSAAYVLPLALDSVERSLIRLLRPPANELAPLPVTFCLPSLPAAF